MISIKNEFGKSVSIRLCKSEYEEFEEVNVECIQRNIRMYVFILSFVSYANSTKRKFYIFVQKNIHVVKALMNYSV